MDLTKREKIGLGTFITILVLISLFLYYKNKPSSRIEVISNGNSSADLSSNEASTAASSSNTSNEPTTASKSSIVVYITGEIVSPGVYSLHAGDRVNELIQAAGGLKSDADQTSVNLAAKLRDEDHIDISAKSSVNGVNTAQVADNPLSSSTSTSTSTSIHNSVGSGNIPKININTADQTQLEELPRIGPSLSQRILDYRVQHGRFHNIDEINDVDGIGPKLFNNIKDKIVAY